MGPSTQVSNNDTSLPLFWRHGKVPGILLIILLTQTSFHQDFSEVYKHFHKELVTSFFTLPCYTGLTGCTGGMGIHQQTPVFMYFRSPSVFPADLAEMWKGILQRELCTQSSVGFIVPPWPGQTQELVQKSRRGYRCWCSNRGKPGTNIAPSHLSHTHTAALAE